MVGDGVQVGTDTLCIIVMIVSDTEFQVALGANSLYVFASFSVSPGKPPVHKRSWPVY